MTNDPIALPDWFGPLCDEIDRELDRLSSAGGDRRPALRREAEELRASTRGWRQSLGNPDLDPALRADLEADYAAARARLHELEAALEGLDGQEVRRRRLLDPAAVLDRLRRLDEVLAAGNPTFGNLELGRHIDRIDAFPDGSVVLRTSKLGIFEGAAALLARPDAAPLPSATADGPVRTVTPRRRGRLRVESPTLGDPASAPESQPGLDPNRFANLDPEWFWEDALEIPRPTFWSDEHAEEVLRVRREHPDWTVDRLCHHFGVTPPTLRKALRIGEQREAARLAGAAEPPDESDPS